MKTPIFDKTGKELKQITLPAGIFDVKFNADLVHDVVTSMASNARANTAQVKDRGAVRGGGIKPWRQKGTGRARVGSSRSPIWRSGGITHGPTNERNYTKKINKKVAAKALAMVLTKKLADNELILIDSVNISDKKTKDAVKIVNSIAKNKGLETLATKRKNAAIVALFDRDDNTEKSFRNIESLRLDLVANMNVVDILKYKYLVIENPEKSLEILAKRTLAGDKVEKVEKETKKTEEVKEVTKK